MTPERAHEILVEGNNWQNWESQCTAEEDREISDVWATMPGTTSWVDALVRIAHEDVDLFRGYSHSEQEWTLTMRCVHEVTFGLYHRKGGTSGEMCMRWYDFYQTGQGIPCLEIFGDAWAVLRRFSDLITDLGDLNRKYPSPEKFIILLIKHGFESI